MYNNDKYINNYELSKIKLDAFYNLWNSNYENKLIKD